MNYCQHFSGNKTCRGHFCSRYIRLAAVLIFDRAKGLKISQYLVGTPPLISEKSTDLIMCTQRQINRLYNSRLGVLEFGLSLCDNKIQLLA